MGPECYRHFIHLQRRAWDAAETESAESPSSALDPNADYSTTTQGHRSWTCGDSARRLRDTGRSGDLCGKSTCQKSPSQGFREATLISSSKLFGRCARIHLVAMSTHSAATATIVWWPAT